MNKRLVARLLSAILLIEAACMVPSLLIALYYGDGDARALGLSMMIVLAVALPIRLFSKPTETNMRAKEAFVTVSLSWLLMSAFGALPFVFSGLIPNYVDAFFECVSGFTTTGSSLMPSFENLPHGVTFWRSFTHWIGGMGVLVLTLALLPTVTGRANHLARAESTGPTFSKIVPKMGDSAKILYIIYLVLTAVNFIALLLTGLNVYDAALHAMGTAGTGGFSNYAASVGAFGSLSTEIVTTVFMFLFGVNFALYYLVLVGGWKEAVRSEELRWYVGIFAAAALGISLLTSPYYGGFFKALRYASFQVASVMSTTGYATADFTLWHVGAQAVLILLMFMGACAGSTAGGMKIVRATTLLKIARREIRRTFQPRKVQVVRYDGKGVDESVLSQIGVFFFLHIGLLIAGFVAVSMEGRYNVETNFTAALTCLTNVGPGVGAVGPAGTFAGYGPFAKLVLSFLMLCGRLDLFPMLVLFHPAVWRKG